MSTKDHDFWGEGAGGVGQFNSTGVGFGGQILRQKRLETTGKLMYLIMDFDYNEESYKEY